MNIKDQIKTVLEENRRVLGEINPASVEELETAIRKAKAIFCSAQGRSGFVLRCFCMRLMHLGYQVYFSGETITPSIHPEDLLIVLSGSGETPSTVEAVKISKQRRAATIGILGNLNSRAAALVDHRIYIPGTTKLDGEGEPFSEQMSGSLFEQTAFIFLEAVVNAFYLNVKEEVGKVSKRHAIIE
ncbi:6-phospho-3-hexuloisomerase [Thermodesulfobacteriota bacterium]